MFRKVKRHQPRVLTLLRKHPTDRRFHIRIQKFYGLPLVTTELMLTGTRWCFGLISEGTMKEAKQATRRLCKQRNRVPQHLYGGSYVNQD